VGLECRIEFTSEWFHQPMVTTIKWRNGLRAESACEHILAVKSALDHFPLLALTPPSHVPMFQTGGNKTQNTQMAVDFRSGFIE